MPSFIPLCWLSEEIFQNIFCNSEHAYDNGMLKQWLQIMIQPVFSVYLPAYNIFGGAHRFYNV